MLALLTGLGFLLASPIANQVSSFQNDVPGYVDDANSELADLQGWLDRNGIDIQVKAEGETALQTIGERITGGAGDVVSFTRDAVQTLVEASLALILIIVLSVYMLIYGERIGAVARGLVPPGDGTPDDDFPTRIQASLFGYVRGQVLFSLIMGTSAGLMLFLLGSLGIFPEGKTYAIAFGAWFAFAELIPYVGPADRRLPAGPHRGAQRQPDRRGMADHRVHRSSSRSKGTSWRRTCSARRCGSTRSWSSSPC